MGSGGDGAGVGKGEMHLMESVGSLAAASINHSPHPSHGSYSKNHFLRRKITVIR